MSDVREPAVEFRGLRMVFKRRRAEPLVAINQLDLRIGGGRVFGLLGPNGSGKTTAVNLLCGLLRPSSGTVLCEGIDVREDPVGVRAHLGVVPQETALYDDLTAQENLHFHASLYQVPARERQERIAEGLDLVGLTKRRHDRAGTFSGGMQRRLALARALLTKPSVVVLDEPTLGVDVQSRAALWQRIRDIADSGGTVLLTTNYMEEAQALAHELAVLDHGRLIASGTPDAMRDDLGQSLIDLHTDLPAGDRDLLSRLPGVQEVTGKAAGVVVATDGRPATLSAVMDALARSGHEVRVLGVRRPDLNDVFLNLTGSALRDGDA